MLTLPFHLSAGIEDSFQPVTREPSLALRCVSYVLAATTLLLVIILHLLPALLAGLLVYELVQTIAPRLAGASPAIVRGCWWWPCSAWWWWVC
ncbi:hypothetical protein [Rhodanobacter lindaniclasticus]